MDFLLRLGNSFPQFQLLSRLCKALGDRRSTQKFKFCAKIRTSEVSGKAEEIKEELNVFQSSA